jgi:hypothetical protein
MDILQGEALPRYYYKSEREAFEVIIKWMISRLGTVRHKQQI